MRAVIIIANTTLDDFYDQIQYSIDQRFHNYQTTFPVYPTSEAEYGEIETNTAYANHASDGLYRNGVHLERLIA
jgi:hypothetical protein